MVNQLVKRSSIVGLCILILSLLSIVPVSAADKNDKQLTITYLKHNPEPAVVGKEFNVRVHVVNIDHNNNDKMEDMDQARVIISLSNGDKQQQLSLESKGSGEYETKVKLSKSGTWDVSLVAMNLKQQKSEKDMDTMETTLEVKQKKDNTAVWWLIGIVIIAILIIVYWLYRRRKKKGSQK